LKANDKKRTGRWGGFGGKKEVAEGTAGGNKGLGHGDTRFSGTRCKAPVRGRFRRQKTNSSEKKKRKFQGCKKTTFRFAGKAKRN